MNTPTHVMISLAFLTRRGAEGQPTYILPAVVGAVLPDAAMFGFYGVEKFVFGTAEREIWSERYFLPQWQDLFDLFNSVPILAVALAISLLAKRRGWAVLFLSMLLHLACDLPLHHDDGHRHFWPISDWRFESPISYWDPNHYGGPAAVAELVLFVACYVWTMIKHQKFAIRIGVTLIAIIHLGLATLAILFLSGYLGSGPPQL
ncbi:MAG: metal-dependent hydrolase [Rubripirellula sp.]